MEIIKKDELIILYLKEYILFKICYKIIKLKNKLEKEDALEYLSDRWNTICQEHFM